jgi:hypothetical protein
MNGFYTVCIDMCIDLRGGNVRMAQHFLDNTERRAM